MVPHFLPGSSSKNADDLLNFEVVKGEGEDKRGRQRRGGVRARAKSRGGGEEGCEMLSYGREVVGRKKRSWEKSGEVNRRRRVEKKQSVCG